MSKTWTIRINENGDLSEVVDRINSMSESGKFNIDNVEVVNVTDRSNSDGGVIQGSLLEIVVVPAEDDPTFFTITVFSSRQSSLVETNFDNRILYFNTWTLVLAEKRNVPGIWMTYNDVLRQLNSLMGENVGG
jgi:hypothetical protein